MSASARDASSDRSVYLRPVLSENLDRLRKTEAQPPGDRETTGITRRGLFDAARSSMNSPAPCGALPAAASLVAQRQERIHEGGPGPGHEGGDNADSGGHRGDGQQRH